MVALELAKRALAADSVDAKLGWVDELAAVLAESATIPREDLLRSVSPAPTLEPQSEIASVQGFVRGIPARPLLVAPQKVPRRRLSTPQGRLALIHAVAHIEFSAIDLALDHALRFSGVPIRYITDWLGVAVEEAQHFRLLRNYLRARGADYGDFPAHDGLWDMAAKTMNDVLARMAMVPRLLEARGLDATPLMREKLAAAEELEAVSILDTILSDEEGHVALGDQWYRYFCAQRRLEPEETFRRLIVEYAGPWPQPPLNRQARLAAGFTGAELDDLTRYTPTR